MSTLTQLYAAAPEAEGLTSLKGEGWGPYARKPNGSGSVGPQGAEDTISWWVKTENFANAVDVICGVPELVSILGSSVVRIVPLIHPYLNNLVADSVRWNHNGEGGNHVTSHTHTRLDVTFRSKNYSTTGLYPFCELITNPSVRSVPSPASAWSVGGATPFRDPDFQAGGSDIEFVMHHCPPLDNGRLNLYARYINDALFLGNPAGCVLYHGARCIPQAQLSTSGQRYSLTFTASSPEFPWRYYSAADGSLGTLSRSGGTLFQFPSTSFANLII